MLDKDLKLEDWLDDLQKRGKHSFSLEQVGEELKHLSDNSIKQSLNRLNKKNKIVSIHRGYYLIISPKYMSMGIIPPDIFIDGLMKYLDRSYYVGLLNAASIHGASHQQPQEFFVFTTQPALRPIQKKGIKINFITLVNMISPELQEKVKTESGYFNVSNPAQTALDLISFEQKIGGLSRASTVMYELAEKLKPSQFNQSVLKKARATTIQRLGYILDVVTQRPDLSEALLEGAKKLNIRFLKIPLEQTSPKEGFPVNEKWKLIINTKIEIDQ